MVIYHGLPRLRCWGFWRTLQAKGEDDGQWSALRHLFFSRKILSLTKFLFLTECTELTEFLSLRDFFVDILEILGRCATLDCCLAAFVFLTKNIISHGMHGMHGIYRCAIFLNMITGEHDFLLTNYHNFFLSPTDYSEFCRYAMFY